MDEKCARVGKWIGGCRFEPRYDEYPPDAANYEGPVGALRLLRKEIYVQDICTRCGKVIQRK